jgi:hypothetical protein
VGEKKADYGYIIGNIEWDIHTKSRGRKGDSITLHYKSLLKRESALALVVVGTYSEI